MFLVAKIFTNVLKVSCKCTNNCSMRWLICEPHQTRMLVCYAQVLPTSFVNLFLFFFSVDIFFFFESTNHCKYFILVTNLLLLLPSAFFWIVFLDGHIAILLSNLLNNFFFCCQPKINCYIVFTKSPAKFWTLLVNLSCF